MRVWRWRLRKGPNVSRRSMEPVRLADELRQCPGKWVAMRDGELIEVEETPDRLLMALHRREINDAVIMRAPAEHEPEMVSFG